MRFHARLEDGDFVEITCDGVLKDRGEFVAFYNDVPKTRTVMRSKLFGAPVADTITSTERQWLMVIPLKWLRFVCPAHILAEPEPASGMEAPSGGETAQTGSTEGDSPTGEAGAPND